MIILAIDPGKQGGGVELHSGKLYWHFKTPMIGKDYDLVEMDIKLRFTDPPDKIVIEAGIAMPMQGAKSTWTNGYGHGLWHGIMAGNGFGFETIRPQEWQKGIPGLTKKVGGKTVKLKGKELKNKLMAYAGQLEPSLPKHSGICDAYLMAVYAHRLLVGEKSETEKQDE